MLGYIGTGAKYWFSKGTPPKVVFKKFICKSDAGPRQLRSIRSGWIKMVVLEIRLIATTISARRVKMSAGMDGIF